MFLYVPFPRLPLPRFGSANFCSTRQSGRQAPAGLTGGRFRRSGPECKSVNQLFVRGRVRESPLGRFSMAAEVGVLFGLFFG